MRSTPAANAVLSTTKLLEKILLRIDAKTLLLSQRTCHKFQEIISGSQWLQKKLFLQEVPTLSEALWLADGEDLDKATIRFDERHERNEEGMLNPLLFNEGRPDGRTYSTKAEFEIPERHVYESSWKGMLLVNPPPNSFEPFTNCGRFTYDGDATLGQFLDGSREDYMLASCEDEEVCLTGSTLELDGTMSSVAAWLAGSEESDDSEDSDIDSVEAGWREMKEQEWIEAGQPEGGPNYDGSEDDISGGSGEEDSDSEDAEDESEVGEVGEVMEDEAAGEGEAEREGDGSDSAYDDAEVQKPEGDDSEIEVGH